MTASMKTPSRRPRISSETDDSNDSGIAAKLLTALLAVVMVAGSGITCAAAMVFWAFCGGVETEARINAEDWAVANPKREDWQRRSDAVTQWTGTLKEHLKSVGDVAVVSTPPVSQTIVTPQRQPSDEAIKRLAVDQPEVRQFDQVASMIKQLSWTSERASMSKDKLVDISNYLQRRHQLGLSSSQSHLVQLNVLSRRDVNPRIVKPMLWDAFRQTLRSTFPDDVDDVTKVSTLTSDFQSRSLFANLANAIQHSAPPDKRITASLALMYSPLGATGARWIAEANYDDTSSKTVLKTSVDWDDPMWALWIGQARSQKAIVNRSTMFDRLAILEPLLRDADLDIAMSAITSFYDGRHLSPSVVENVEQMTNEQRQRIAGELINWWFIPVDGQLPAANLYFAVVDSPIPEDIGRLLTRPILDRELIRTATRRMPKDGGPVAEWYERLGPMIPAVWTKLYAEDSIPWLRELPQWMMDHPDAGITLAFAKEMRRIPTDQSIQVLIELRNHYRQHHPQSSVTADLESWVRSRNLEPSASKP